jgi:hypothetical protein
MLMKFFRTQRGPAAAGPASSPTESLGRRGLVVGAGVAGAAALAAAVLHRHAQAVPEVAATPMRVSEDGGYQVTPHVLRYYETTRS